MNIAIMLYFCSMQQQVNIKNKRARFEYELMDQYTAGIVLTGTEIKSIRAGKASIAESFCSFSEQGELFLINMHIEEYSHGGYVNHKTKGDRKLLLQKKEIKKLLKEVQNVGLTIVPLHVFITIKAGQRFVLRLQRGRKYTTSAKPSRTGKTKVNLIALKKAFVVNSYLPTREQI
jgi:SsrA-binding protein